MRRSLTLQGHLNEVWALAFSPDGRRIVTGGWDKAVKVWETATPNQLATWQRDEQAASERMEPLWREQLVAAEQARHDELVAQLEYVRSDEYVERWARGEARLARPGEVAVVVLEDEELAGGVQPTPTPEPEGRPFWAEVWEAVFGPAGR